MIKIILVNKLSKQCDYNMYLVQRISYNRLHKISFSLYLNCRDGLWSSVKDLLYLVGWAGGVAGMGVRPEVSRWLGWCLGGGLMVCHCLAGALRVDLLRYTPCGIPKLTADYG